MSEPRCDAPTRLGGRCSWPAAACPHHRGWRDGRSPAARPAQESAPAPSASLPADIFEERDLHSLAWWTAREVVSGAMDVRAATVVASLLRVLATLGPAEMPAAGSA